RSRPAARPGAPARRRRRRRADGGARPAAPAGRADPAVLLDRDQLGGRSRGAPRGALQAARPGGTAAHGRDREHRRGARRQCNRAAAALRRAAPRRVAGRPGRVPGEAAARHRRLRWHDSPPRRVGQRGGGRADAAAGRLSATQGRPARAFFWALRIPAFTLVAAAVAACPGQAPDVTPKSARDAAGAGPAAVRAPRDTAMEQRVARLELRLLERDAQLEELQARLDEARQEVVRAMAKLQTVASRAEAASAIAEGEIAVQSLRAAAAAQPATDLAQATTLLQQAGAEFAKQNYGGALYLANQAKRVAGAGR